MCTTFSGLTDIDDRRKLELEPEVTVEVVAAVFRALSFSANDAALVATELVESERMGVKSHGLIRIREYVQEVADGRIAVDARPEIVSDIDGGLIVDGHNALGIVTAVAAVDAAIAHAGSHAATVVVTRNCNHVNRLGSYAERASRAGFVCLVGAALGKPHHVVAPWDGSEARLGTNPFAFGLPAQPHPIVADFATSVVPEGRVRLAHANGELMSDGVLMTAEGVRTTDPAAFYGPPRGAIMPFGGPSGHKGYALSLLVEALGGALAGDSAADAGRQVNGLFLMLVNPMDFPTPATFEQRASELGDWMRSTRPAGAGTVRVPGDLEFAARDAATFHPSEQVWAEVSEIAVSLGIDPTIAIVDRTRII